MSVHILFSFASALVLAFSLILSFSFPPYFSSSPSSPPSLLRKLLAEAQPSLLGREEHVLAVWDHHHWYHCWLLLLLLRVHHILLVHQVLLRLDADLVLPPGWSGGHLLLLLNPGQALAHSFGQGLDKIRILEATDLCRLFLLGSAQAGVVFTPAHVLRFSTVTLQPVSTVWP